MNLQSKREFEVTRQKLRGLEDLYASTLVATAENAYARDLTLRSMRRIINQLKEDIARFEARSNSAAQDK